MTGETISAAEPANKPQTSYVKRHLRDYSLLLSLLVIMAFFQFMTNEKLLEPLNITNIILQNSYVIIMALGMLLVIIQADIDLSVGSVVGFIGGLAAVLMVNYHANPFVTSVVCLVVGAMIGAAQGFWVAYFRIPAFIVTLAGYLVFRGLCLALLQGQSVGPFPRSFQQLSTGFIPDVLAFIPHFHTTSFVLTALVPVLLLVLGVRDRAKRKQFGVEAEPAAFFAIKHLLTFAILLFLGYQLSSYKGLPNVLIIMAVLIAAYAFLTQNMTLGRRIYALGGNEKAAQLSGIDTKRLRFYSFMNMGVLAALAGLVFAARLNTATPKAGVGFELDVIAACFIGGASPAGGVGKVTGAVIGAFIMGVMNNGMSIVGIGIDWQQVIKGLVLLSAVIFDVYNKNKS